MNNPDDFQKYGRATAKFTLNGSQMYGRLVEIVDGDTVNIVLPVCNNYYKYNVRLYGIDTCEIHSKNPTNRDLGIRARDTIFSLVCETYHITDVTKNNAITKQYINDTLDNNVIVVLVECLDFDKYGRLLANVWLINDNVVDDGHVQPKLSISDYLLQNHLAYSYTGSTKLTEDEQIELLLQIPLTEFKN